MRGSMMTTAMNTKPNTIMKPNEETNVDLATPTVTLNGDTREHLVNEWWRFGSAIERAISLFPYESFHARNQLHGDDEKARRAFMLKQNILSQLDEYHSLSLSVVDELAD